MSDSLPPGPQLPPLVQAVAYHRDPLGVLQRCRARYGPAFTLRFPRKDPLVFAADPQALPSLLHADPERAHAGEARRAILPLASPLSPFGGDEANHHHSRASMWDGFSPERIATIEPAMAELAERAVTSWPRGRPFRLLEATRELCTQITARLVLDIRDPERADGLVAAIRRLLRTPGNPPLPVPGDRQGPVDDAVTGLFSWRSSPVRALLGLELSERRRRGTPGDGVLGSMLSHDARASDAELIESLLVVLAAAQEPPGIALANVLYELAGRRDVAERFQAEPQARRAIIAEVLRLRPSASAALRRVTEPTKVDGHVLPAGTTVACPSPLLHRDPQFFDAPDEFRADRFIDGVPPEAPYLPFGGGLRRCIGEHLAEAQFRAVLPTVLGQVRLRRAWPREERMVVRATVLVPDRSALAVAA